MFGEVSVLKDIPQSSHSVLDTWSQIFKMTEKSPNTGLETVETNQDFADIKASGDHIEEVRIARLTEEDFFTLSAESLQFKSWTMFRLSLIMFVFGCGQAGYGIDWVSFLWTPQKVGETDQINIFPGCHWWYKFVSGLVSNLSMALSTLTSFNEICTNILSIGTSISVRLKSIYEIHFLTKFRYRRFWCRPCYAERTYDNRSDCGSSISSSFWCKSYLGKFQLILPRVLPHHRCEYLPRFPPSFDFLQRVSLTKSKITDHRKTRCQFCWQCDCYCCCTSSRFCNWLADVPGW